MFSPQVKRELAGVLIFESHAKAGTVCKCQNRYTANLLTYKMKSNHSELNSFKRVLNFSVIIYDYLSSMCLCSASDEFDVHYRSLLFLVFNQGEEGTSWYIILKGSVNVVIYGKVRLVIPY